MDRNIMPSFGELTPKEIERGSEVEITFNELGVKARTRRGRWIVTSETVSLRKSPFGEGPYRAVLVASRTELASFPVKAKAKQLAASADEFVLMAFRSDAAAWWARVRLSVSNGTAKDFTDLLQAAADASGKPISVEMGTKPGAGMAYLETDLGPKGGAILQAAIDWFDPVQAHFSPTAAGKARFVPATIERKPANGMTAHERLEAATRLAELIWPALQHAADPGNQNAVAEAVAAIAGMAD